MSFQGITVDDVGFDRSIKQGGKERPTLFDMVMRCWLRPLSAAWKERRQGYKVRAGTKDEDDELLLSHEIFADSCCISASSRTMLLDTVQK